MTSESIWVPIMGIGFAIIFVIAHKASERYRRMHHKGPGRKERYEQDVKTWRKDVPPEPSP